MTYIYKNPIDDGYLKFKVSKKEHNAIFPKSKLKFFERADYYYSPERNCVIIERFTNTLALILETIFFTFTVIYFGISNFKEILSTYKKSLNQKKHGTFFQEKLYLNNVRYEELLKLATVITKRT